MRSRSIRRTRVLLLVALLAWVFSPSAWRYVVPLWLPFLVALGLEIEFAVGGWLGPTRRLPPETGHGPQRVDLERFGWAGEQPDEDDPSFWNNAPVARRPVPIARRLAAPLAVLGIVAAVAWGISVRRGWTSLSHGTQVRIEHVLSRQAGTIAGHPALIRCDSAGRHVGAVQETDGVAEVGGQQAWLTPAICFRLYQLIDRRDTHSSNPTGRALVVLAHEAWHLHGIADEGVTNCYAYQSGVDVGIRMGLSAGAARSLMHEQLANNGSDSAGDPRYLVPAGCRNGDRFDLKPDSSQFP